MRHKLLVLALLLAAPVFAEQAQAWEPQTTGVVLMHGKWGNPGDAATGPLGQALKSAGFLVDMPEMPWSGGRAYDLGAEAAMSEIDAAVARLQSRGAAKIVVAGQSMGGAAAVEYASLHRPIDAAIFIAPAHAPEGRILRDSLASAVAQARAMVASGRGDDSLAFMDFNSGSRTPSMRAKAASFVSYFAPDSPIAMSLNAPNVGPIPVLWVCGTLDPSHEFFDRVVWPRIPAATPKERVDVIADHLDVPTAGRSAIIAWLKKQG